ncbi:MAG: membrane dipeptidase [Alphaproteobacteria bacterium]|nr:membrane dipeptidase [Alphaproteobacteria bacterium]
MPSLLLWLALGLAPTADAEEVRGQIDWQGHPAMHLPWRIYGKGLTERTPKLSYKHAFRQTMHAPYVEASGVRILLTAAMAAEKARSAAQARDLILQQLRYVEAFVETHPDRFALARTPAQARDILATTDKIVVIHSIEGGRMLLSGPEDAAFWADQGVALVTLIHLVDDELGGAAINPEWTGPLINREAVRKRRRGQDRGLTQRGRDAIVELDRAGILVDLSHMSPQSLDETLVLTAEHGIAPVLTHAKLDRIQDSERGLSDAQVVEIYRQGGVVNTPLSGTALEALDAAVPAPADRCPGSIDDFRWHHEQLRAIQDEHLVELFGVSDRSALTDAQRTALAVGWSSDWNGGIGHTRPRYGRAGCLPRRELPDDTMEIDRYGLAHPGLLPQQWVRLEQAGFDLDPMLRSAERFLQLWEQAGR